MDQFRLIGLRLEYPERKTRPSTSPADPCIDYGRHNWPDSQAAILAAAW